MIMLYVLMIERGTKELENVSVFIRPQVKALYNERNPLSVLA